MSVYCCLYYVYVSVDFSLDSFILIKLQSVKIKMSLDLIITGHCTMYVNKCQQYIHLLSLSHLHHMYSSTTCQRNFNFSSIAYTIYIICISYLLQVTIKDRNSIFSMINLSNCRIGRHFCNRYYMNIFIIIGIRSERNKEEGV